MSNVQICPNLDIEHLKLDIGHFTCASQHQAVHKKLGVGTPYRWKGQKTPQGPPWRHGYEWTPRPRY